MSNCTTDDSQALSPRERAIRELDRNGVDWKSPPNAHTLRRIAANCQEEVPELDDVPISSESLEARALKLLQLNPQWPLGLFARTLGCSIADLQAMDSFRSAFHPTYEAVATFLRGGIPTPPAKIVPPRPRRNPANEVQCSAEMNRRCSAQ